MDVPRGLAYSPMDHAAILGVEVIEHRLRDNRWGEYDDRSRVIYLDPRLNAVEARSVLAHECQHAIHRDVPTLFGPINAAQERRARLGAAQMLVSPVEYAAAEEMYDGAVCAIAWALDVIPEVVADWRIAVASAVRRAYAD